MVDLEVRRPWTTRVRQTGERPDTDDAVETMLAVAAREVDESCLAAWLRQRVTFDA